MKKHNILNIFHSISLEFQAVFSRGTGRPDEIGIPRENKVRDFLKSLLPDQYAVSKGYVINHEGQMSDEIDIIVHNKSTCPRFPLDQENNLHLIPIEEVLGVIEVKSTLSVSQYGNCQKKISSFQKVFDGRYDHIKTDSDDEYWDTDWTCPFKIIFSYNQGGDWEDYEFIYKLHSYDSPDAVFILSEGSYIYATDDTLSRRNSFTKKITKAESDKDTSVWDEITVRFSCEDRSRHYENYLIEECCDGDVLLSFYTFILDEIKFRHLPDYNSADYVALWKKSNQDGEPL